jgi:peptidylprolyl isomerase
VNRYYNLILLEKGQTMNPHLLMELDNGGSVVIECLPDLAPKHVSQIVKIAETGDYDGTEFHRVIPGFMAQGGWTKKPYPNIEAEFTPTPHVEGICSMARTNDPNSAVDQIFICFQASPWLDNQYTVWGKVVKGMDSVHGIAMGEPPVVPTKITRMRTVDPATLGL